MRPTGPRAPFAILSGQRKREHAHASARLRDLERRVRALEIESWWLLRQLGRLLTSAAERSLRTRAAAERKAERKTARPQPVRQKT